MTELPSQAEDSGLEDIATQVRTWQKSSYSGGNSGQECVEVALNVPHTVAIRDSKDPEGPISTRMTVTLPTEQVAELKKLTDNVSGHVAEAAARQLRHQLLGGDLLRYQEEHGAFSEEELAEARSRIFGG